MDGKTLEYICFGSTKFEFNEKVLVASIPLRVRRLS